MKIKNASLSALLIGTTLLSGSALAAGNGQGSQDHNPAQELAQLPFESISALEETNLLLMREEEKLARDVYLTLYDTWGTQIFSNIAKSEQKHTDAVKALLDKYSIADPVRDDTIGVFTSPTLQNLYNELVAKGNTSLVDAFQVGLTIEDLDIYDLQEALRDTDNEDITKVYESLEKGSRNHLRAFNRQLEQNGGTYSAQFLSQGEVDAIATSAQEKGGHGKKGGNQSGDSSWETRSDQEGQSQGRGKGQRGQGRGMGQDQGFNDSEWEEGSSDKVSPSQSRWGQQQGEQRGRGQGRGQGRQQQASSSDTSSSAIENTAQSRDRNDSFSNQSEKSSSRNFYHFFAQYFPW